MTKMASTITVNNVSDVIENQTDVISGPKIWSVEHLVSTSLILGIIIFCTIIGNAFVIAAICLEKNLHCAANYLILSLAVADFIIGSVVMPISAVNEVTQRWFLGSEVCHMWIAMDVLCCTASILSLVAISIYRYRATRSVNYTRKRTAKHIITMITVVWLISVVISLPSILLFNDDTDVTVTGVCMMSQNPVYRVYATVSAFYLPTFVLLVIYAKIFIAVRERIRRKRFSRSFKQYQEEQTKMSHSQNNEKEISCSRNGPPASISESEVSARPFNGSNYESDCNVSDQINVSTTQSNTPSKAFNEVLHAKKEREKVKRKKEKRLAVILTIITGTFIICWLPFFILEILVPFIPPNENIPKELSSTTLWLGYCNSLLNPIIYTVFSVDFRTAFKNLILGKCLRRCGRNNKMDF